MPKALAPLASPKIKWRMQKAMQLLQQRDQKHIDVARSVGYESDAAFSKAFKQVVAANPGEYLKRGFEGHGIARTAKMFEDENSDFSGGLGTQAPRIRERNIERCGTVRASASDMLWA